MHEMSLCESVVRILENAATAQGFSRVKTVWLEIGALSHVEPDSMRLCFDACSRGTLAEGASLEILRPEGRAWCMDCAEEVTVSQRYDACPKCGGFKLQVTGGDEMRVHELEVE